MVGNLSSGDKGDFEHFMLKEIFDGPEALRQTLSGKIQDNKIVFSELNYEVKKFDDKAGVAEIYVQTQRRESTKDINGGEPFIQGINISLVKVNGDWLFDKAYWQE